MNDDINTRVNWLDAVRIIQLLEGIGVAINESDTIAALREAVRQAVIDGDITLDQIDFKNPSKK